MLVISFALLSLGVLLGGLMLAGRGRRAALVHGLAGAGGLAALALVLRAGGLHGKFAWDALGLGVAALCGGLVLASGRRAALVVFLHASAGGLAYLLLAGFVFG